MKTLFLRPIAFAVLPLLMFSCTKEAAIKQNPASTELSSQSSVTSLNDASARQGTYKTYVIEQGRHYADGVRFPPFSGTVLSFSAVFNNSAMYDFSNDPNIYYDQNTLYGFADNNKRHEQFSARFGWRWFNNELQIAAYTINNGMPTIEEMTSVPLNTAVNYSIEVHDTYYLFTVNGVTKQMDRASSTTSAGPYKLLPYFGGNATAPHRITIKIKENSVQ